MEPQNTGAPMDRALAAMLARANSIDETRCSGPVNQGRQPTFAALDLTYPDAQTLCVDLLPEPDFLPAPFAGLRPDDMVLVIHETNGARTRTKTDLGIVSEPGAGVHDAQIIVRASSSLTRNQLTALLDDVFSPNARRAQIRALAETERDAHFDAGHWYDATLAAIEALATTPQEARLARLRHAADTHLHPLLDPGEPARYHLALRPRSLGGPHTTVSATSSVPATPQREHASEDQPPDPPPPHSDEDRSALAVAKAFRLAKRYLTQYRNIVETMGSDADRRFAAHDCDDFEDLIGEVRLLVPSPAHDEPSEGNLAGPDPDAY